MSISIRKPGLICVFGLAGLVVMAPVRAAEPAPDPAQPGQTVQSETEQSRWILSPEAAINAPQPIQLGLEAVRPGWESQRLYASIGYALYPFTSAERSFHIFSVQAGARFFPWGKKYFASTGFGYRHLGVTTSVSNYTIDGEVIATGATLTFRTLFLAVAVGAEFPLSSKLDFSFDLGLQVGLLGAGSPNLFNKDTGADSSNSETLSVGSEMYGLDRLARLLVPQITLARLTWRLD